MDETVAALRETLLGLPDDEFEERWGEASDVDWPVFSEISLERDRRRRMGNPRLAALAAHLATLTTLAEIDRHREAEDGIAMSEDWLATYADEYHRRGSRLPQ